MTLRPLRHFTSFRDLFVFFSIPILWTVLPLLLLFPLEKVLRRLTPSNTSPSFPPQKVFLFAKFWFSRRYIARWNSCLKQSLILYYFLNRYGTPVKICIGVKKGEHRLTGHSWIEYEGNVFGERQPLDELVRMYTYPESQDE